MSTKNYKWKIPKKEKLTLKSVLWLYGMNFKLGEYDYSNSEIKKINNFTSTMNFETLLQ